MVVLGAPAVPLGLSAGLARLGLGEVADVLLPPPLMATADANGVLRRAARGRAGGWCSYLAPA